MEDANRHQPPTDKTAASEDKTAASEPGQAQVTHHALADKRLGNRPEEDWPEDWQNSDRREGDRRQAPLPERLKRGLWKVYAAHHDLGIEDWMPYSPRNIKWLVDELADEARRYRFRNKFNGNEAPFYGVLEVAIAAAVYALEPCDRRSTQLKAMTVIEAIAKTITAEYNLEAIDRRRDDRRDQPQAGNHRQGARRDQAHYQADQRSRLS